MSYATRCDESPVIRKDAEGFATIEWRDDKAELGFYEVHGKVIAEWVEEHNELVGLRRALRTP